MYLNDAHDEEDMVPAIDEISVGRYYVFFHHVRGTGSAMSRARLVEGIMDLAVKVTVVELLEVREYLF